MDGVGWMVWDVMDRWNGRIKWMEWDGWDMMDGL